MRDDKNSTPNKKDKDGKMVLKSIYFEPNIWKRAKERAGLTPLSAVIRRLVELWLDGKIKID